MRPGIDPARLRPARMSRPHLPAPDRRHLLLALGAGAAAALCGLLGLGRLLDDLALRRLGPQSAAPVVVLGLDASGPSAWTHERLAELLERLRAAGVRGIGLDLPAALAPSADPVADARLARALIDGPVVLGVNLQPQPGGGLLAQLPAAGFVDATGLGHVWLPFDGDGRIRRHHALAVADDGIAWPSLALALARTDTNADRGGDRGLPDPWPVAAAAEPQTLQASALLADRIDPQRLRGQWVLVGPTDPARQARLPGPHGSAALFPVQHQARALADLLVGHTPRPLAPPVHALLAWLLATAAVLAGGSRPGPGWRMPTALLAGILASLAVCAGLLARQWWFAPGASVGVLALALAGWAVAAALRHWHGRRYLPGLASSSQLHAAVAALRANGAPHALLLLQASAAGDARPAAAATCPRRFAGVLRTRARRPDDLAAWLGDSRFALLLHGIQAPAAESVREQIREQATAQGLEVQVDLQACTGQEDCACLRRLEPAAGP